MKTVSPFSPSISVALFDMDRTLVRKETASLYVRYLRQRGEANVQDLARVALWVGKYTLGVLDHEGAAAEAAKSLKGIHETVMAARCDDWVRTMVTPLIGDTARRAVAAHQAAGHVTAIVTGASPYAANPVARHLGIDHVVASTLVRDAAGYFVGAFEKPLCVAEGKVTRTLELLRSIGASLDQCAFYTDSCTDLPLLRRVAAPMAVNPDMRLRRRATREGIPVQQW